MNKFNAVFNNFYSTLTEDTQLPAVNTNNNQLTPANNVHKQPEFNADFEVVDSNVNNTDTTNGISDDELCEKIAKHQMELLIKEHTSIEHIISIIKNAQILHNADENTDENKESDNKADNEQLNKQSTELLSRITTQLEELSNDSSDESK